MKRPYEMTVVFRILVPDDEMQKAIDQVVAWIENSNEVEDPGRVTRIDRNLFGRRRLAYEINGQREGLYLIFYADIETAHLPELELNLKLYDPVLRYLIVRDEGESGDEDAEAEDEAQAEAEVEAEAAE